MKAGADVVAIPFGPFVLEKPIGRGGMGEVWKGRHVVENEPVAVKIMHRETLRNPDYVAAFRNEVRHIAGLNHPGIVVVFDYGEVPAEASKASGGQLIEGSPYLVMEYARKGSLLELESYLSWPELRRVLLVVLDALGHAHARDVIHRDLKPENILVGCGDAQSIKLTDFGLAHAADRFRDSSKVEDVWGTPQYMAPEQLRGLWRDYGPWTDLYSLGCMVYQLVCGKFPFNGPTVWEIGRAHLTSPIPALEARMGVPPGFEEWLVRLMQKERYHRFTSAADAAWALRSLPADLDGRCSQSSVALSSVQGGPANVEAREEQIGEPTVLLTKVGEAPTIVTPTMTIDLQQWFQADSVPVKGQTEDVRSDGGPGVPMRPPIPWNWTGSSVDEGSPHLLGAGLGLYGLRAIPFIDRDVERGLIWETLRGVDEGQSARAIVLRGPAGVGKSELAQWMCRRSLELGAAQVLRARHNSTPGFGDGLEAMLGRHLRCLRLGREEVESRLRNKFRRRGLGDEYTVQAMTELLAPIGGQPASPEPTASEMEESGSVRFFSTRQRYALIYEFLEHLAKERPLILWFDDVQWGADALGFAHYVLKSQGRRPAPILMLLTVRDESLEERPSEQVLLREVLDDALVEVCTLEPLSREDTAQLVKRLLGLDDDLVSQVEKRAQGIPLFAVQLIGDWVSRGKLVLGAQGFSLAPGEVIEIPDDLHALWGERLRRALQDQGEFALYSIEIAAALGKEVDTAEWRSACHFGKGHARARMAENLIQSGLAELTENGWVFSHGMLRESVIRTAREEGRWEKANAACAHMLYHLYQPRAFGVAERYGWHMIESGWPKEALEPFLTAVDLLIERSEFRRSHALLDEREDIICRLGDAAEPRDLCEGWIRRATIFEYEGRYAEAFSRASQAVQLSRQQGWEGLLAQALLQQGVAEHHLGRLDQAEQDLNAARHLFEATLEILPHGKSLLGLGRVAEQRGDFLGATTFFDEARDLFERSGELLGVAQCLNALGDIARQGHDFSLAQSYSRQSLQISKRLGYQIGVADSLNDLSEWDRLQGDYEAAKSKCLEARALYQVLGSSKSLFVELNLGLIYLEEGDFEGASELYEKLEMDFRRTQQWGLLTQALVGLMAGYAREDNWEAFDWCFAETLRLLEQTGIHNANLAIALAIAADAAEEASQSGRAQNLRRLMRGQREAVKTSPNHHRTVVEDE